MTPSEAVREFLRSRGISYGVGTDDEGSETAFYHSARGNCCSMAVRITAVDGRSILRAHVSGGARASVHVVAEVENLLRWANADDPFGMFMLDRDTRETCYVAAVKRIRREMTPAAVARIVELAATRWDRIQPSLSRIILNFERADNLITTTETPHWERLMESVKDDLKGLVFVEPEPVVSGNVLTVGHVVL
jgi:hypothetical protein